ncbi:MAG TPA: L,D-transpeptidase family protein [Croceibacterium sp.]|nr:L,D-transpeptidase family protein [Croceibacterium sp.]
MSSAYKWIGAATAAVVLFFASAGVTGAILDAREAHIPAAPRIEANAVLGDALAMPAQASAPAVEVATTPASDPVAPDEQPFVIKRILPIDGPIKYGEWHWDAEGAPAGPLVITVDLDARVLSVFRGGYEIGATAVMLGTQEHPTPVGTFPILSKERHNISEKYNNAPMPWTLRLTWDGVAIHGGAEVERGYASHGCIGAPNDFISKVYAIAKKGDRVIITRGKTAGLGDRLT